MRVLCDWATALKIFHGNMVTPSTPLYVVHAHDCVGKHTYAVTTERTGEYVMLKRE